MIDVILDSQNLGLHACSGSEGDTMRDRQRQKGFSLIELLIVVTIILIIMAMAMPNLKQAKMTANDTSAIASLRALTSACMQYSNTYGGFPPTLASLGPANTPSATAADLIDTVLANGTKSGYRFTYTASAKDAGGNILGYTINADPITVGTTGLRQFFTDQTGTIRANVGGPADKNSSPIG